MSEARGGTVENVVRAEMKHRSAVACFCQTRGSVGIHAMRQWQVVLALFQTRQPRRIQKDVKIDFLQHALAAIRTQIQPGAG